METDVYLLKREGYKLGCLLGGTEVLCSEGSLHAGIVLSVCEVYETCSAVATQGRCHCHALPTEDGGMGRSGRTRKLLLKLVRGMLLKNEDVKQLTLYST